MTILDRPLTASTEQELLAELAECISLEGEAKARAQPIRAELLRRQVSELNKTGDVTPVEHDGWVSNLKREPLSVKLICRHYGYDENELPKSLFVERVKPVLDKERVKEWLDEEGRDSGPIYSLEVRRKKQPMKVPTNG